MCTWSEELHCQYYFDCLMWGAEHEGEQDGGALEHEDSSEWSLVDGDVNDFELP